MQCVFCMIFICKFEFINQISIIMNQPTIPDKLYGRSQDIQRLLETFEEISSGHGEVLLIPGTSGVGKTALAQELRIPIQERNSFFISGKFDQYHSLICKEFVEKHNGKIRVESEEGQGSTFYFNLPFKL